MNTSQIFIYAWGVSALFMLLMWILQYRSKNAGIVDVVWSFLTPIVGVWLILADEVANGLRQYIIIILALIWGLRLGTYLFYRVTNEIEDGRYRYM
ncbi:MAG: DUF1295 domain-containing protein, partial [Gammaproteobacteria bacterium]